jgi:hypothetical protein
MQPSVTADGSAIRELAGPTPRVLLCCSSPSYCDDDTVMTGG